MEDHLLPRKFRRTETGDDLRDDYDYEYDKGAESSGKMDEGSGEQEVTTERESIKIAWSKRPDYSTDFLFKFSKLGG